MYPPAQPVAESMLWLEILYGEEEIEQPLLSISQSTGLEDQNEDNILYQFNYATTSIEFPQSFSKFDYFLIEYFQEQFDPLNLSTLVVLLWMRKWKLS